MAFIYAHSEIQMNLSEIETIALDKDAWGDFASRVSDIQREVTDLDCAQAGPDDYEGPLSDSRELLSEVRGL